MTTGDHLYRLSGAIFRSATNVRSEEVNVGES
jgi:hypothetical protein